MILENTIRNASQALRKKNIASHQLDAEIILSHILNVKREFLITKNDIHINKNIIKKFNYAIDRRKKNEPIAYITGQKEFWSRNFYINKFTLVPRPETELLIYNLVNFFKNRSINILDVGTGSGCILLTLLKELKLSRGTGIDISQKAVKVAKINSKNLKILNRSKFKVADINKLNYGKYDLIVSNPPYILFKDLKNLSKDIRNYEPIIALNGGLDGLDIIKKVIFKSKMLLKTGGLLALEIGNNQYKKVLYLLIESGYRIKSKQFDNIKNVRCIISTKM